MRKSNHKRVRESGFIRTILLAIAVGMITPATAQNAITRNVDRAQFANYATNESNRNVFDYDVAAALSLTLRF